MAPPPKTPTLPVKAGPPETEHGLFAGRHPGGAGHDPRRRRRDALCALALHVGPDRPRLPPEAREHAADRRLQAARRLQRRGRTCPRGSAGVTCCSTGNHGRGVAYAAARRGLRAVVCMSELVPQAKVDGIRALGAEVSIKGRSQDEAWAESQRLVEAEGLVEISPFDDRHVIAGQGTIGFEMVEARPDLDTVLVPLSGGGLAAGVAVAAEIGRSPDTRDRHLDGPRRRHARLDRGRPSGGGRGGAEPRRSASAAASGSTTGSRFPLCRDHLDEIVLVSEEEIYHAMQVALLRGPDRRRGRLRRGHGRRSSPAR